MKFRLTITPKLTLVFVLFALTLLAGISSFAIYYSSVSLQAAVSSELQASAIEKQGTLTNWVKDKQSAIQSLTGNAHILADLEMLIRNAPDSQGWNVFHQHLIEQLEPWTGNGREFITLMIIEPGTGKVLVATNSLDEGKFRENMAYFIYGQFGAYVQNPYYSPHLQGLAMTISAPIYVDDRLIGVLAGRLYIEEMNEIISLRSGLRNSDEAYLANTASLFVTQPRLMEDEAVLRRGVHTEHVNACLAGNSGVMLTDDYRDVPVIAAYRWLTERQLCLVVKLDRAEALSPGRQFGMQMLVVSGMALLLAAGLGLWLSSSITRPVHKLAQGARQIGQGNLDYHIQSHTKDELGCLAETFNEMGADLKKSLGETARNQRLILALAQAAQTVQRASRLDEIYHIVSEELSKIGYLPIFFALTADKQNLFIPYRTIESDIFRSVKKLTGLQLPDYHFALLSDSVFQHVLDQHGAAYFSSFAPFVADALPLKIKPLAERITTMLKINQVFAAPLFIAEEPFGLMLVASSQLNETDLQAIDAFANQTSIALENIKHRQHLEEMVATQTKAIRASEAELRALLASMVDVILVLDDQGKYLKIATTDADKLYLPSDQLLGQTLHQVFPAETADTILAQILRTLAEKRTVNYEYNLIIGDREFWFNASISPMNAHAVVWVARDISARKQAEEKLTGAMTELTRSNTELEQFAYVASHDLQEPLRMVSSYMQLLERRYKGQLDADADEFIHFAVDGANRMKRLINDLLLYSRVGTQGKELVPTDSQEVLDNVLDNLQFSIKESGASVTHDPLSMVLADDGQLAQLFQNLIGNAIKFHKPGEMPRVHIASLPPDAAHLPTGEGVKAGEVLFSVRDHGIGFDNQYAGRIFVIFERLHTNREYEGTGIGLAICKKIVNRHGGRIWVESTPGEGSHFYFTLPAASTY